jgi:hypothetical protein
MAGPGGADESAGWELAYYSLRQAEESVMKEALVYFAIAVLSFAQSDERDSASARTTQIARIRLWAVHDELQNNTEGVARAC